MKSWKVDLGIQWGLGTRLTPRPGHLFLQVDLDREPRVTAKDTEAQRSDTPASPYELGQDLSCRPQSLEPQPLSSSLSPPTLPKLGLSPREGVSDA